MIAAATVHDLKKEKEAKRELHKHKDLVEQKKQYEEYGDILHYNPLVQQNIAFLGFHNKYMSGHKNGKFELKADKIGESEIFTTIPITKGIEDQSDYRCKVAIMPYGTDLYLCCTNKDHKLKLQPHCRNWEYWIVEKDEKTGMFSFKSFHNTYLCAQSNGKPSANKKKKGDWEKWRIIIVQQPKQQQVKMVENTGSYYQSEQQPKQQQVKMVENTGSYYQTKGMVENDGSYY